MDGTVTTLTTTPQPKRKADRRIGLHDVVREVATDCLTQSLASDLRPILLARLRRVVQAKSLQFSEIPPTPALRTNQPVRTRDYVAYAVATGDADKRVVLEASFGSDSGLDDWSCQFLQAAASLATIIFEIERLTRLSDAAASRPVDGAAPLIGSSVPMHALRERIERVATTDFTVLIEGAMRP